VEHYNKVSQHHISEHIATLALSFLVMLFAEIIPKALFRDNSTRLVKKYLPLISFFSYTLKPLIKFVEIFNNFLAKAFNIDDSNAYHHISRDDISFLLSEKPTDMHEKQREMIEDALEFAELKAENVMIHRTEVVAIHKDATIPEVIEIASEAGFTRFPVYDQDLDDIVGILIIYDLLKADPASKAADYMRKPNIIPETMNVDAVLSDMQANKNSIAVVIDSYGGTAGIISIEDILEEIVGEIEDEYDVTQTNAEIQQLDEDNFIVQGFVEIDYLNDEYEMELPDGDYETVAGMIIDKLAKIPPRKTKCLIGSWEILVIQATNKKIIKLKFTRLKQK